MNRNSLRFFFVLFLVIGVTLVLFIGHYMVSVYRGSMSDVDEDESEAIDCYQHAFRASFNDPDNMEIENTPLSSHDIDIITLEDLETGETFQEEFSFFSPGNSRSFNISEFESEQFAIYPGDCQSVQRVCSREDMECIDPDAYNR